VRSELERERLVERRDRVMAVLQRDVDVAKRSVAALIEGDQTIACCEGDISRHGDQQRQSRHAYENQRQQHRSFSLDIALEAIAGKVADALTARAGVGERLNGTLNQTCAYAGQIAVGMAEKKVDAAEQAFKRAMAGAGGVGFARADADTINRVGEIDGMQKSATVAERLAALKARQAA
jgi:phage shock protein A